MAISTGEERKKKIKTNKPKKKEKTKTKKTTHNQIAHTLSSTMEHLRITVVSNFGDRRERR